MTKLSVLMPVYNEARTLRTIVGRVMASPIDLEIELICVDDCSKDNSLAILHELAAADAVAGPSLRVPPGIGPVDRSSQIPSRAQPDRCGQVSVVSVASHEGWAGGRLIAMHSNRHRPSLTSSEEE